MMRPLLPSKSTALACLVLIAASSLLTSCIDIVGEMVRESTRLPFVSTEDLSPACLDAVYKYLEDVTLEENVRWPAMDGYINQAFKTGDTFYLKLTAPNGDETRYEFYFSRDRTDMLIILRGVTADVTTAGGGHTIVNVNNNIKGAHSRKLPCVGPFHGKDMDVSDN